MAVGKRSVGGAEPVHDVAVIGGGIVGLAAANALLAYTPRVAVVEGEMALGKHQTGHNSGVIHSGLYYKPGSLKARNCAEGRDAMYRFCEEHGITHERCGKIVVATHTGELAALNRLAQRARENGLEGVRTLEAAELKEYEPNVEGVAGLHVPQTGIVDFLAVLEKYAALFDQAGGTIYLGYRVVGCSHYEGQTVLETTGGPVHCRAIINCSGLHCDRVARLCGVDPGVRIVPFRGEYYELAPERRGLVRNLIYPVPDPNLPFLGVHFTRRVDGSVEAGPNAVLAFKREGYTKTAISPRDVVSTAAYGGFWRMSMKFWKTGIGEMHRSLSKKAFVEALRGLMPSLEMSDVQPAGAGVRAQAVDPKGKLVDDFHIVEAERQIHVLNAPSPAATASLSIGASIAQTTAKAFGWR